jgi:hypothetical protein
MPAASERKSWSLTRVGSLFTSLSEWPRGSDFDNHRSDAATALALFVQRVHDYGRCLEDQDIDEISEILGERQRDLQAAEAALEDFVLAAGPNTDAEIVRYFHRWTQRQQFLVLGTGARHEELIHISPQPIPNM